MKWYFSIRGGHTHVRVFMNGGKCGDLCFRNEEFREIQSCARKCPTVLMLRDGESSEMITFIDETGRPAAL